MKIHLNISCRFRTPLFFSTFPCGGDRSTNSCCDSRSKSGFWSAGSNPFQITRLRTDNPIIEARGIVVDSAFLSIGSSAKNSWVCLKTSNEKNGLHVAPSYKGEIHWGVFLQESGKNPEIDPKHKIWGSENLVNDPYGFDLKHSG